MKKELPDFLSGCCFLLSRKVIEEVGYFDEDYHSYYEDVDFSISAKRKGYILSIIPEAKLWHYHSASTESVPEYKIRMISRNSILLLVNNFLSFHVLFITCSILRGILQNLSQKNGYHFERSTRGTFLSSSTVIMFDTFQRYLFPVQYIQEKKKLLFLFLRWDRMVRGFFAVFGVRTSHLQPLILLLLPKKKKCVS